MVINRCRQSDGARDISNERFPPVPGDRYRL